MQKTEMIAICGDNCACCPRYLATQTEQESELEKARQLWIRLGFRDKHFPLEAMACTGCQPENPCAYAELRECVDQQAVENCGFCDTYPCEKINRVFDRSDMLMEQAKKICTKEEIDLLKKAFFYKKRIFDSIKESR